MVEVVIMCVFLCLFSNVSLSWYVVLVCGYACADPECFVIGGHNLIIFSFSSFFS